MPYAALTDEYLYKQTPPKVQPDIRYTCICKLRKGLRGVQAIPFK